MEARMEARMADPIATVAGPPGVRPGVRPGVGHQAAPALVVTAPVSRRAGLRPDPPADAGPGVADRELSWLDYVERVLSQAEDRSWSLLERVRFLALACRHLDRSLQVRMAGIQAPAARLATIRATAARLRARQACVFADDLRPALAEAGTAVVDWDVLDEADQRVLLGVFEERVAPLLEARTIQAGRPLRPPPGLALNLVVRSAAR